MREIKFRAWDKKNEKYLSHGELFALDCSNEYPFLALLKNMYSTGIDPLDVSIEQYTGMKDKNCVEIYEGDIVKCLMADDCYYDVQVEYSSFSFNVYDKGIGCSMEHFDDYEVIGNIHENSYLLNNK